MKRILVLLMVGFFSVGMFSQENKKPKYEVVDDLVQVTIYHSNGKIAQIGTYDENGKLHGEWNSFDASGIKKATAFYDEGRKTGTWIFYNGNQMKKVNYNDSKIDKVKTETRVVSNN